MENEILKRHFEDLATLLRQCVHPVAGGCFGKDLISTEKHNYILESRDEDAKKARILLKFVMDTCTLSSKDMLSDFFSILESQIIFTELIRKMQEEMAEHRIKAKQEDVLGHDRNPVATTTQVTDQSQTHKAHGLSSRGTDNLDTFCSDMDIATPIPETLLDGCSSTPIQFRRVHSQVSSDSGISLSPTTLPNNFGPFQETQNDKHNLTKASTFNGSTQFTTPVPSMRKLDRISELARHVQCEVMQSEAVKIIQQEKIQHLSEKLEDAIIAKRETMSTLNQTQTEINKLRSEVEEKNSLLMEHSEEIQRLKNDISQNKPFEYEPSHHHNREDTEAIRRELTTMKNNLMRYEQQAGCLHKQLEEKEERIKSLREEIQQVEHDNLNTVLKLKKQLCCEKRERQTAEGHKTGCTALAIILCFAMLLMAVEIISTNYSSGSHCWLNPSGTYYS